MSESEAGKKNLAVPIAIFVSALVIFLQYSGFFDRPELWTVDLRFHARGAEPMDDRIVLVDINDQTLKDSGWPLSRAEYANLIAIAAENGAHAVGFDLVLANPQNAEEDQLLGQVAKAAVPVIFPAEFLFAGSTTVPGQIPKGIDFKSDESKAWQASGVNLPIPPLLQSTKMLAHVQFNNTKDGVYRQVPIVVSYGNQMYPSLGFQMALYAAGVSEPEILMKDGWITVENSDLAPIPVDKTGTATIGYKNVGGAKINAIPLHTVLDAYLDAQEGIPTEIKLKDIFSNKIVIVGPSAKSIGDLGPTPFFSNTPLVLGHVNTADNVLTGGFIRQVPFLMDCLIILLCGLLAALVSRGQRAHYNALVTIGASTLLFGVGYLLFTFKQVQISLVSPFLNIILCHVLLLIYNYAIRDKHERLIRQAFSRYVSPEILNEIVNTPDLLRTRGSKKTISIMFSDIKGYTALSNEMSTDEIMQILNAYLNIMVEEIFAFNGTVDKIMGDGIMCFFGDPVYTEDHALNAVRCATSMHKKLQSLQEKWNKESGVELQTRIGVATGEVFVGNIGSAAHLEYTAIGSAVNLAARLEANGRPGKTTLSSETYHKVKNEIVCRAIKLELKGYAKTVEAYEVESDDRVEQSLQEKQRMYEEMRQTKRLDFESGVLLEVDGHTVSATCLNISSGGMFISYDNPFPKGTETAIIARLPYGKTKELYRIDSVVVRLEDESGPNGIGMGVKFMQVTCESMTALEHLVKSMYGQTEVQAGLVQRNTDTFGREILTMQMSDELSELISKEQKE